MASSFSLTNKVAIITGSNSGIGQATAILFAQRGASVVLCGRDEERLKSSVDQCIQASGGHSERFVSAIGDLTDAKVRESIVKKAVDSFQRVDILVCNAGRLLPEANGVSDVSEAVFDETFNVNVKSVFFMIQAALPELEKSKGNIVNVSSLASKMVLPGTPIYPMSKAAVDHMTRCLALDLAQKGIRVNSINPSFIPTRMHRSFDNYNKLSLEMAASHSQQHPLYGECVTTEAIAEGIAFFASESAKYITGQCHFIDGGRGFAGVSVRR